MLCIFISPFSILLANLITFPVQFEHRTPPNFLEFDLEVFPFEAEIAMPLSSVLHIAQWGKELDLLL
jgi:hypothetical protein